MVMTMEHIWLSFLCVWLLLFLNIKSTRKNLSFLTASSRQSIGFFLLLSLLINMSQMLLHPLTGCFTLSLALGLSVVPCPVLNVASWPAYRFLKRQVSWSGIPISFRIFQFVVIHIVKGFGIVSKAEIDVFLELSCIFDGPADVGNLISGSSAFFKPSLNIRKFTVHILLKPGLENFEYYFTSMWDECNCAVVWAFFCIAFLWQGLKYYLSKRDI